MKTDINNYLWSCDNVCNNQKSYTDLIGHTCYISAPIPMPF